MHGSTAQNAGTVVMVRPRHFSLNSHTAVDNEFQQAFPPEGFGYDVARHAMEEFDAAVEALRDAGVAVHVFEDGETALPDSVFPNNWISTHPDGTVVLYPLLSPRRRPERRRDVLDALRTTHEVRAVVDYTPHEEQGRFLEGTGALVLDHVARVAYATLSRRADRALVETFCRDLGFEPIVFGTAGASGQPIYHTNVLMCIGTGFALAGLELIPDPAEREAVRERLRAPGREVIELTREQIENFAGNAIELRGAGGPVLVLSTRAAASLRPDQRERIEAYAALLPLRIPTIELSGGSARCMIVTIHLPELPCAAATPDTRALAAAVA